MSNRDGYQLRADTPAKLREQIREVGTRQRDLQVILFAAASGSPLTNGSAWSGAPDA